MLNTHRGLRVLAVCATMVVVLLSALPVLRADSNTSAGTVLQPEVGRSTQEVEQVPAPPAGESELVPELEDRLVILPEIKREGERFFSALSSCRIS